MRRGRCVHVSFDHALCDQVATLTCARYFTPLVYWASRGFLAEAEIRPELCTQEKGRQVSTALELTDTPHRNEPARTTFTYVNPPHAVHTYILA